MLSSYIVYFMRFVITVFNVYCLLAHVLPGELTTLQTRHITVQQWMQWNLGNMFLMKSQHTILGIFLDGTDNMRNIRIP